jgi:putative oxidoreductase
LDFRQSGFHPPEVWVYIAAVSETAVGMALVLGICTRFAALGAATVLAIAVYSLQMVKGSAGPGITADMNIRCSGASPR